MFLLNTLKHHLPSIVRFIKEPKGLYSIELLAIGNALMDIYTGDLTVQTITEEIAEHIKREGIDERQNYIAWIQQNGFQKRTISDGSEWILLIGDDAENYVHIHPARYSPHSLRVKATTLKTAICWLINRPHEKEDTEPLNMIRSQIGLSPIKNLSESQHLSGLISLIKGRMQAI